MSDRRFAINRGLFSDHFLTVRLREQEEWGFDYAPIRSLILATLQENRSALETANESQTEDDFIRPVLKVLGWYHDVQVRLRRRERDLTPDYALFLSRQAKRAALATRTSRREPCGPAYLRETSALGEAKYWGRPLEAQVADQSRDRQRDRRRSPHFQIIDYLDDADVRWGVLTNGALWRLYYAGPDTREITYYEADLVGILTDGGQDDFKRFALFFRASSFEPVAGALCLLDRLREQSQQYASAIEARLKDRVFDHVVPTLAQGFVRYAREVGGQGIGPEDRERLDIIYRATLLLLYRLFFLLYAESRNLIAVGDGAGYRARGLAHLKEEVYRAMRDGIALGTTSTDWWEDLSNVFRIINGGDRGLSVPRYNGGLFAPDGLGDADIGPAARFLEDNKIADEDLAQAVLFLTRDGDAVGDYAQPRFIDYRDLGVRHLGSVYEGLLEFKLQVARTYLVQATDNGKPVWRETDDREKADKLAGDLYLTNDKSERKATGSYYTPDYIVRYIVENTVGPLVDRIEHEYGLAREVRAGEGSRREWAEIFEEVIRGKPEPEAGAARELWAKLGSDSQRRNFLLNALQGVRPAHRYDPPTRVLELTCLDPALGSGHFLVGALDYLTSRLAVMMSRYPDSPVSARLQEDRQKIVESLGRQGIAADPAKLTDENLLRRMVLKRCLYGVDLNPLAVELSKVSLWLHAFTAGAPLSFLDHHIKCGNSLIGSSLEELQGIVSRAGGLLRLSLAPLERAVQHMLTVAELSDASFEDVARSREEYWQADRRVDAYRALLDALTAQYFGLREAVDLIEFGHDLDLDRFEETLKRLPDDYQQLMGQTRRIAHERRWFHWEVEFPEVFFEGQRGRGVLQKDAPGFSCVVGNPPYDVLADKETGENLQNVRDYARQHQVLSWASGGKLNLYELFFAQGLSLCSRFGMVSFILPMGLLGDSYAANLRGKWLRTSFFRHIEAFPQKDDSDRRVFREAKLPTAIVVVDKRSCASGCVRTHTGRDILPESPSCEVTLSDLVDLDPATLSIPLAAPGDLSVALRLLRRGWTVPFGAVAEVRQGEINETSMDQLLRSEPSGHPVVRGGNVQPYEFIEKPKQGATKFLCVRDYLAEFAERSRTQDHRNARIGLQRNAALDNYRRLIACRVPAGRFCFDSVNYVAVSSYALSALLALLNSRLLEWRFRLTSTTNHVNAYEIHVLPVRRILFVTLANRRQDECARLQAMYRETECGASASAVLTAVEDLLPKTTSGEFVAFRDSITTSEARRKTYIAQIPKYLDENAPSGLDADGNPLEHSDVVHDFLGYLADQMVEMHKEKQVLWAAIRHKFENAGISLTDLSALSVTKSMLHAVEKARAAAEPNVKHARLVTYAQKVEEAFALSLSELSEAPHHRYSFAGLPRLGFERFKWLAALRGVNPDVLDDVRAKVEQQLAHLRDVLERIGSDEWYPRRDPGTDEYDLRQIRSTDWLIDQVVYRLYGLREDEVRVVEGSVYPVPGEDASEGAEAP